jgi:hypothetical protein
MRILSEFGYFLLLIIGAFISLTLAYRRHWPILLQIVGWAIAIALCVAGLLFRGFYGKGIEDVVAAYLAGVICQAYDVQWCETSARSPPTETNGPSTEKEAAAQRVAIGDWVEGIWIASEFDVRTNIVARIEVGESFKFFGNLSRPEIVTEGGRKALYLNGKRVSDMFDDIEFIRQGANHQMVAANVRRRNQWTVAINGKPWDSWFDELFQYAVISRVVAIGVKIGEKWTMAVDGVPWKQRFDAVHDYNAYADGSVIAEVSANGRHFLVKDGREDARLPQVRFIRINRAGKIAWYDEQEGQSTVTVNYGMKWKSTYQKILGLGLSDSTGQVVAKIGSRQGITLAVDDVQWSNWYQSSQDPRLAICYSSAILRVQRSNLSTLAVNDRTWSNSFDEVGPIGCESSGVVSAAVKSNGKWAIARSGKVLGQWFAEVRGWAINQEGTLIAAAVADKQKDGKLSWRVIVMPL